MIFVEANINFPPIFIVGFGLEGKQMDVCMTGELWAKLAVFAKNQCELVNVLVLDGPFLLLNAGSQGGVTYFS